MRCAVQHVVDLQLDNFTVYRSEVLIPVVDSKNLKRERASREMQCQSINTQKAALHERNKRERKKDGMWKKISGQG